MYVTKEELEQAKVETLKTVQEIINETFKNLNDYTDGLHGNSTQDITKLNAAVMDLSTDFYSDTSSDEDDTADVTSEKGAN